jgi:ATP-dependent Clp protease protease subunit
MRNARIIVNQPLGGVQGSYIDVKRQAAEQNRNLKVAQLLLSRASGMDMDAAAEMLDRDTFLSAEQAVAAGIIDSVL